MNDNQIGFIKEQIEFLKADLNREVPLNMESQYQPGAAEGIIVAREETKRLILSLLEKLATANDIREDRQHCRELLERMASDKSSLEMVKEAMCNIDDEDTIQSMVTDAAENYEVSKREIAKMIIEKLT